MALLCLTRTKWCSFKTPSLRQTEIVRRYEFLFQNRNRLVVFENIEIRLEPILEALEYWSSAYHVYFSWKWTFLISQYSSTIDYINIMNIWLYNYISIDRMWVRILLDCIEIIFHSSVYVFTPSYNVFLKLNKIIKYYFLYIYYYYYSYLLLFYFMQDGIKLFIIATVFWLNLTMFVPLYPLHSNKVEARNHSCYCRDTRNIFNCLSFIPSFGVSLIFLTLISVIIVLFTVFIYFFQIFFSVLCIVFQYFFLKKAVFPWILWLVSIMVI